MSTMFSSPHSSYLGKLKHIHSVMFGLKCNVWNLFINRHEYIECKWWRDSRIYDSHFVFLRLILFMMNNELTIEYSLNITGISFILWELSNFFFRKTIFMTGKWLLSLFPEHYVNYQITTDILIMERFPTL